MSHFNPMDMVVAEHEDRMKALRTELEALRAERDRYRAALEEMIRAGRDAYDNGYPEMERAVVMARKALEEP